MWTFPVVDLEDWSASKMTGQASALESHCVARTRVLAGAAEGSQATGTGAPWREALCMRKKALLV